MPTLAVRGRFHPEQTSQKETWREFPITSNHSIGVAVDGTGALWERQYRKQLLAMLHSSARPH
jgi:hypothetical protein